MLLLDVLESYLLSTTLNRDYMEQLRDRVGKFDTYCGGGVMLDDLSPDAMNRWIEGLSQTKLHPVTVRGYRAAVMAVWNWAYANRLTDRRPERIRRVKVVRGVPVAFTLTEISSMLRAAETLSRFVVGTPIRRSLWFICYIHISYATALRLGDVLDLVWSDLRDDRLAIPQNKTNEPVLVGLSPVALRALELLPRCDERILPWPGCRTGIFRGMKRIVEVAGVRDGTGRWLRRSAASYLERDRPGHAARLLGHKTPGLAERHYLDPTIVVRDIPSPPAIEGVA